MEKLSATMLCISTALLLTGCGGGGASSLKSGYTSFSSVPANTKVDVAGRSVEASYTASRTLVDEVTDLSMDTAMTTSLTYDSAKRLTRLSIATDNGTLTWEENEITYFQGINNILPFWASSQYRDTVAFLMSYADMGFNYQTFGVWMTGIQTGGGRLGATTVGVRTNNILVPTTGTASFTGNVLGFYIDAVGEPFLVSGDSYINANFSARSLAFTTSNSKGLSLYLTTMDFPELNLSGTLSYETDSNSFSGAVSTVSALTGSASGHFYGPAAQEAGGVFAVTGSGVEGYRGSFGTVR